MAIDLSGLPLVPGHDDTHDALRRRASARRSAAEAWLDRDSDGIDRVLAEHSDLADDLDPLRHDLSAERNAAAVEADGAEARDKLGGLLGRLAGAAGDSDDPGRRSTHGALARRAIDEHRDAGLIGRAEAEDLGGDYDARLAEADAARLNRDDPALARRLLADPSMFPGLAPDRRDRLMRQAAAREAAAGEDDAASARATDARRATETLTRTARARADLGRRIAAGEAGLADIAAAEAAGDIGLHDAVALRRRVATYRDKTVAAAEGIARVEATLVAGGRLDPGSAADRAALDAHYLQTRRGWDEAGLSPGEVGSELAEYIADAGCFPDEVCRRIGRIFRVGTPEERWQAAGLIRTLEEREPALLGQLDPDDVREGLGIGALERAGYPPVDAAARYQALIGGKATDPAAARDRTTVERVSGEGLEREGDPTATSPAGEDDAESEQGRLATDDPALRALLRSIGLEENGRDAEPATQVAFAAVLAQLARVAPRVLPLILEEMERHQREKRKNEMRRKEEVDARASRGATQKGNARTDAIPHTKDDQILPGPVAIPVEPQIEILDPPEVDWSLPGFTIVGQAPNDLIEIVPADPRIDLPLFVERKGNPNTRRLNTEIARLIERLAGELGIEIKHVGGARDVHGQEIEETYLPGPFPNSTKDGNFLDIAHYIEKTKRWIFINTIDVRADGTTPTTREATASAKIRAKISEEGHIYIEVPKEPPGKSLDAKALGQRLIPYLEEAAKVFRKQS